MRIAYNCASILRPLMRILSQYLALGLQPIAERGVLAVGILFREPDLVRSLADAFFQFEVAGSAE